MGEKKSEYIAARYLNSVEERAKPVLSPIEKRLLVRERQLNNALKFIESIAHFNPYQTPYSELVVVAKQLLKQIHQQDS